MSFTSREDMAGEDLHSFREREMPKNRLYKYEFNGI
jgi:hypothetical protein